MSGDGREARGRDKQSTIELRNVSRWYGNVVAVNDISVTIGPGVTGLLGLGEQGRTILFLSLIHI